MTKTANSGPFAAPRRSIFDVSTALLVLHRYGTALRGATRRSRVAIIPILEVRRRDDVAS
jgi:hypothetical protein